VCVCVHALDGTVYVCICACVGDFFCVSVCVCVHALDGTVYVCAHA